MVGACGSVEVVYMYVQTEFDSLQGNNAAALYLFLEQE